MNVKNGIGKQFVKKHSVAINFFLAFYTKLKTNVKKIAIWNFRTRGIDLKIFPEMMCAGYEDGQKDACVVCLFLKNAHF